MHHLSLCTGIGGIDFGLKNLWEDFRTVAMVERDAFSCACLVEAMERGALDQAPIYPDLHRFPWSRYRGLVDLITSGFPCQPFANSGKQRGEEDERYLWPVIRSGIELLKPAFAFFENVPGIATMPSMRDGGHSVLHNVLCDMEHMGYSATARLYTAAELGASHKRQRWFILALSNSDIRTRTTWQPRRTDLEVSGEGGGLSTGQNEGQARCVSRCVRTSWPVHQRHVPREWERPRTLIPGVDGATDGISRRMDRLAALGNSVVPAVVEHAFLDLYEALNEN